MLPRHKSSIAPCTAADLNPASGPEVGPGKLFFACPNDSHRLTCSLCQTCRLHGTFARMLATITAPHVRHDYSNPGCRNTEGFRQFITHSEWSLRSGPHS